MCFLSFETKVFSDVYQFHDFAIFCDEGESKFGSRGPELRGEFESCFKLVGSGRCSVLRGTTCRAGSKSRNMFSPISNSPPNSYKTYLKNCNDRQSTTIPFKAKPGCRNVPFFAGSNICSSVTGTQKRALLPASTTLKRYIPNERMDGHANANSIYTNIP